MDDDKKPNEEEQYVTDTQNYLNDSYNKEKQAFINNTENETRHEESTSGKFHTRESLDKAVEKKKTEILETKLPQHESLFFGDRGGSKEASDAMFDKEREGGSDLQARAAEREQIRQGTKKSKDQEQEKKTEQLSEKEALKKRLQEENLKKAQKLKQQQEKRNQLTVVFNTKKEQERKAIAKEEGRKKEEAIKADNKKAVAKQKSILEKEVPKAKSNNQEPELDKRAIERAKLRQQFQQNTRDISQDRQL